MKTKRKNSRTIVVAMIAFAIIALGEYSAYSSFRDALFNSNSTLFYIFTLSLFILPIVLIATTLIGFKYFSKIGSFLYTISSIWLGLIIYLFMGSVFLALYIWLNYFLHIPISNHWIAIDIFAIANIFVLYGVWNSFNPRTVVRTITAPALSKDWVGKKLILVSDTHLGHMQRSRFAKRFIEQIKKENPDIVFHVGDIIDGPIFPYTKSFRHFESLNPPLGFLYTEGNHERYSRDYNNFRSAFPKNITDLTDKKTIINNTQIIGLSYRLRESKEELKKRLLEAGYDNSQPSIILLHDPTHRMVFAGLGVSLVLSGHTHGGQFFPDTLIAKAIFKKQLHGVVYKDSMAAITTYGTGMALVPLRIGTFPEILVITITE